MRKVSGVLIGIGIVSIPLIITVLVALIFGCDLVGKEQSACNIYGHDVGRSLINFAYGWSIVMLLLIPVGIVFILFGMLQALVKKVGAK
jgi:hypothetical protein